MSSKTQIFFTGATGYLGGEVIDRLLRDDATRATSEITALARTPEKAAALQSLGIKTVLGSYDDHALLEQQASQSNVIFSIADSDNAGANDAILRGLKKRFEATGERPILIHTTGTAIVMDEAQGDPSSETVWDDTDVARMDTIPDTKIHRNVDAPALAADKEGYVKTYLISPPTIFGSPSGRLVGLGVQHTRSIQVPMAVACSIKRKRAGYVGKGENVWPVLHIDDTADLFMVVYRAILDGKAPHGRDGTYFGENGHYTFKDVSGKIGEALLEQGASETAEPNSFTPEDFKAFPFLGLLGTNCKVVATRARALGWQPKHTNTVQEFLDSIQDDVKFQLKA